MAAGALAAGPAVAADPGFYVGGGMGLGSYSINEDKLTHKFEQAFDLLGFPDTEVRGKANDDANNWSLYVGYRIMDYLAVEAAYLDLNGAEYRGNVTIPDLGTGQVRLDWSAQGFPLTVLGIWPINDTWEVFGRVGVFIGDVDLDGFVYGGEGDSGKISDSASSTQFIGGVGVDAYFMENLAVRFEWMAMPSIGDDDVGGSANWNELALSLLWKF
jgi:hypothetical protein